MPVRLPAILLLLAIFAPVDGPARAQPAASSWQGRIQNDDRQRLAGLWRAWTRSIAQIETAGETAALQALGPVGTPPVEPLPGRPEDTVRLGALPVPGAYQCRLIRMGLRDDGWPRDAEQPLMTTSWGSCSFQSEALGTLRFDMHEGRQRIHGRLWPDGDRMVFLGAIALASEEGVRLYGDDPDRDALGVLRPLSGGHWRVELPWPRWQSNLMIVEIKGV